MYGCVLGVLGLAIGAGYSGWVNGKNKKELKKKRDKRYYGVIFKCVGVYVSVCLYIRSLVVSDRGGEQWMGGGITRRDDIETNAVME